MNAPTQQPQDPAAAAAQLTFQALAQQRNEMADRLAHSSVVATQLEQHAQVLAAQNADLQSQLDAVNAQLETTKAALADTQARSASIDAANVELTKRIADMSKPLEARAEPAVALTPAPAYAPAEAMPA